MWGNREIVVSKSCEKWYNIIMNYDEIDVEQIVNEVSIAVAQGNYRKATKKESMEIRLAALAMLVKNMQCEMHDIVQNEKLSHAQGV